MLHKPVFTVFPFSLHLWVLLGILYALMGPVGSPQNYTLQLAIKTFEELVLKFLDFCCATSDESRRQRCPPFLENTYADAEQSSTKSVYLASTTIFFLNHASSQDTFLCMLSLWLLLHADYFYQVQDHKLWMEQVYKKIPAAYRECFELHTYIMYYIPKSIFKLWCVHDYALDGEKLQFSGKISFLWLQSKSNTSIYFSTHICICWWWVVYSSE